jgi:hypothetical protein
MAAYRNIASRDPVEEHVRETYSEENINARKYGLCRCKGDLTRPHQINHKGGN